MGYKMYQGYKVSTHSRPKAAGLCANFGADGILCFNTQPPEGGWILLACQLTCAAEFQHTAARRRLGRSWFVSVRLLCFNTQPPEGGWPARPRHHRAMVVSTHSRPKAAG